MAQNNASKDRKRPSLSIEKGHREWNDRVLLYHGFKITLVELGEAVNFLYNNEERVYPRSKGFKGGEMLREFLNDCMDNRKLTPRLLRKYKLNFDVLGISKKGVNLH